MLINAFKSIQPSYQLILKDKFSLLMVITPMIIGVLVYIFLGQAFLSQSIAYGDEIIQKYLSDSSFGKFLSIIITSILTILLFFIVNWTFVLFLSILASPFNDFLSQRIEKLAKESSASSDNSSFADFFKSIPGILFNEIKKVILILLLSLMAFILGYIPVLTPISVGITVLLLAISYLDYSWSRHDLSFKDCKSDIKKNFFSYLLGGGMFMVLVPIPIVNVIVPSLATSFFTVLWVKNNEHRG